MPVLAQAQLKSCIAAAAFPVKPYLAVDRFGEESVRASVRTRPASVHYTAELLSTAVRIKIDVPDGYQEAEQTTVSMNDLHVLSIAARYSGSWTGQMKIGQSWI